MTSPNQILINLLGSPASTGALADTMRLPALVVQAMAKRHAKDSLVIHSSPGPGVDIWSLTDAGRKAANKLNPAPAVA